MRLEPREVGDELWLRPASVGSLPRAVTPNHGTNLPSGLASAHSPLESFPACPLPRPGACKFSVVDRTPLPPNRHGNRLPNRVSGFARSRVQVPAHHEELPGRHHGH